MRAGRLDRRIVIQQATLAADTFGQMVETWATVATVWAGISYLSVSESQISDALHSQRTIKFTLRYRSDITELMQIVFENQTYKITGITEIGRRQGLEILGDVVK